MKTAALYLPGDRAQDEYQCLGWATANGYAVTTIATTEEQFPDLLRLWLGGVVDAIITPSVDMLPGIGIIGVAEATSDPTRQATRRTHRLRRPEILPRTGPVYQQQPEDHPWRKWPDSRPRPLER